MPRQSSWFSNLRSSATLVAAIALGSCGGSAPPPTPPPQASPSPEQKKALDRADALIADMKKRQAALEQSDRAASGKAAQPSRPAVVEASPPPKPTPAPREAAPSTPTTTRVTPQVPRGVDLVSSNYTVAERGQAFWRFSWKTSVRNFHRTPIRVRVEMEFRDGNGVLISTGEQTLNMNVGAAADATGFVSVKATDGPRVASATPRISILK